MTPTTDIESLKSLLANNHLLGKYGILRLGIFGSFARGEEANDIDLYIEQDIDPYIVLEFKEELERLTNMKIDLVLKKYANPIILYRAKQDMLYVS